MDTPFIIQQAINTVLNKLYGLNDVEYVLEHPANADHGDYATNVAMVLSKKLKQSPIEIAKKIVYELSEKAEFQVSNQSFNKLVGKVEVAPPGFINFTLDINWLHDLLNTNLTAARIYGAYKNPSPPSFPSFQEVRIALEHSNVNPNKAAHVGHLRNACIGQFIERIYEEQGYNVEVQYYANNAGVQVATSMMGCMKLKDISPLKYKKYDHYAWDVYSQMESLVEADSALKEERAEILKQLEDPYSQTAKKQKELADKILLAQLETFSQLNIDYDVIIYESDILGLKLWEKAFELLKTNPGVYYANEGKSAGCWLVKMDQEPDQASAQAQAQGTQSTDYANEKTLSARTDAAKAMEVEKDKIIVRSNGVPTYTGKDIAYHMWKFGLLDTDFNYEKWDTNTQEKELWVTTLEKNDTSITFSRADKVYNVIGTEQSYAMEVVKRALNYLGYEKYADNMRHINYGFVYLSRKTAESLGIDVSDGKKFYAMSGRKGWGIKIDDLIDMIDHRLEADYGAFAEKSKVRNGAIKFQMLRLNTFQDLIFDIDEALDLKGYSGPYIQYCAVRANSVLEKSGQSMKELQQAQSTLPQNLDLKEIELLRTLYKFSEIVDKAAEGFSPNILCEYLYLLAKKYNTFYNDVPILSVNDETTRQFRLRLSLSVHKTLTQGLELLGIEVPAKM